MGLGHARVSLRQSRRWDAGMLWLTSESGVGILKFARAFTVLKFFVIAFMAEQGRMAEGWGWKDGWLRDGVTEHDRMVELGRMPEKDGG